MSADEQLEVNPSYEPRPGPAKTIGMLNVIFGGLLLACAGCSGVSLVTQVVMAPMMKAQGQQMQLMLEAEHEKKLARLRQEEKEADTDEEKDEIRARRKAEEAKPIPKFPNFAELSGFGDWKVMTFGILDISVGAVMNIAMIIAGIGLMRLRNWARVMALWVAGLKIFFLITLQACVLILILPGVMRRLEEAFSAMAPAGGAPVASMLTVVPYSMAGGAILNLTLGVIYPIITLVYLTRPGVIAACSEPIVWEIEEPPAA